MSQVFREFFTFNKSDRNGMILLILLLIAFITIPKIQDHLVVQKKPDFSSVQHANLMPSDPARSEERQQTVVDNNASTASNKASSASKDQNTPDYKKSSYKKNSYTDNSSYTEKESKEQKGEQAKSYANDYSEPIKKPAKKYETPKIPVVLKDFDPNKITLE